jgi:hypothetical protein
MYKDKNKRRVLVILLMALGAILIFMATEAWTGYVLVALGVVIELIGIKLGRK